MAQPGRPDRLALVDIARPGPELEHDVQAGEFVPVRQRLGLGGLPAFEEPAEGGEALVVGQLVAEREVELPERREHRRRPVGVPLVVAAEGVAGVVPAEERLEAGAWTPPAVGDEQRPWGSASRGRCDPGCPRTRTSEPSGSRTIWAWIFSTLNPKPATDCVRVRFEPLVIGDQGGQEAARGGPGSSADLLRSKGGTSITPSRSDGAEEPGRHAVVEVDVVQHEAEVALAPELGMDLGERLALLDRARSRRGTRGSRGTADGSTGRPGPGD